MGMMCSWFGHKVDRKNVHRRVRGTYTFFDIKSNYHSERYSRCLRCHVDISYIRYFDIWKTESEIESANLREFIGANYKKIEKKIYVNRKLYRRTISYYGRRK